MQIRETRQGRKLLKEQMRKCRDGQETEQRQFKEDILKTHKAMKNFKNCIVHQGGQKHKGKGF